MASSSFVKPLCKVNQLSSGSSLSSLCASVLFRSSALLRHITAQARPSLPCGAFAAKKPDSFGFAAVDTLRLPLLSSVCCRQAEAEPPRQISSVSFTTSFEKPPPSRNNISQLFSAHPHICGGLLARSFSGLVRFGLSAPVPSDFDTKVFSKEKVQMADRTEYTVRGNRDLLGSTKLAQALNGIRQIGVIGWGSQAPAQAQNLRDSLQGLSIRVKVGLRPNSPSIPHAEAAGFSVANGTLGDMYDVLRESDLNLILILDAVLAENYQRIFEALRPGSYLGLSHGFLLGYLDSFGCAFPKDVNVIAVCPKGMGPSVRRLYEQGKAVNGAGINCSFAVHQDVSGGRATDVALAWAIALGSPVTFQTTLEAEYKSDIFGERGILLGAVHGICEMLYRYFRRSGRPAEEAYLRTVDCITGPISRIISHEGLLAVYDRVDDRRRFEEAFSAAYHPAMELLLECYDEVASGREILSVCDHVRRLSRYPLHSIDSTELWKVAALTRAKQAGATAAACSGGGGGAGDSVGGLEKKKTNNNSNNKNKELIDGTTAGVYLATMLAQCDVLIDAGHCYSEVVNESIIESVDSLNPYMHFKGVSYMVDNCSTTARLGARKWAPRFDYLLDQQVISRLERKQTTTSDGDEHAMIDDHLLRHFRTHKIHEVMKVCCSLRPSVDISPVKTLMGEQWTSVGKQEASRQ